MRRLERLSDLRATVGSWRQADQVVGLVTTMGGLHEGHLALVRQARADCQRVLTTIFVNPLQFNETSDLESYPSDLARDLALLAAEGVDAVFTPPLDEVYPDGFQTRVVVPGLTGCLCGVARPGHMEGVATVVTKLLVMAGVDRAYFGEKDYQQLLIVQRLALDLNLPVEIIGVPTVRDADGLALSSRNALLSPAGRKKAAELYHLLANLAERLKSGALAAPFLAVQRQVLLDQGFDAVDYLDLRAAQDLNALDRANRPARLFAAAWLDGVRLIDNVAVPATET